MKEDKIFDKLMDTSLLRNLGLKRVVLESIIAEYNSLVLDELLENSHIELDNGMNIEVVQILNRVHVLRGVPYPGHRRYKLKLTMGESLYQKIHDYYEKLKEDIGL